MFLWTKTLESCKARQTAFTWRGEMGRCISITQFFQNNRA